MPSGWRTKRARSRRSVPSGCGGSRLAMIGGWRKHTFDRFSTSAVEKTYFCINPGTFRGSKGDGRQRLALGGPSSTDGRKPPAGCAVADAAGGTLDRMAEMRAGERAWQKRQAGDTVWQKMQAGEELATPRGCCGRRLRRGRRALPFWREGPRAQRPCLPRPAVEAAATRGL